MAPLPPRDQRHQWLRMSETEMGLDVHILPRRWRRMVFRNIDWVSSAEEDPRWGILGKLLDGDFTLTGDFLGLTHYYVYIRGLLLSSKLLCLCFGNTWGWVAPRLKRQSTITAGTLEDAEGAHDEIKGDYAVPAPMQAPQPPPAAAQTRTMP
ncbi:hypothetical protein Tco_1174678 [Tanacetum coccineum]